MMVEDHGEQEALDAIVDFESARDELESWTGGDPALAKSIKVVLESFEEAEDHLMNCFSQACGTYHREHDINSFHHQFLSAYEHAQQYLINRGIISKESCEIPVE